MRIHDFYFFSYFQDEAQGYVCFCALMKRLKKNFLVDGVAMTKMFQHLSEGLTYYDPEFFAYLKINQADDLLFCYRWLLLEMKREFAFEDSLQVLGMYRCLFIHSNK